MTLEYIILGVEITVILIELAVLVILIHHMKKLEDNDKNIERHIIQLEKNELSLENHLKHIEDSNDKIDRHIKVLEKHIVKLENKEIIKKFKAIK